MRVAIIGAGIGGLAAARHTLAAGNIDVTVFEQSDRIGGTWAYKEKSGVDEYGLQVSSSAYPDLISNSPKETTCYPDFPYGEKDGMSFLHATEVISYLERFVDNFKIAPVIRFRHHVLNVRPQSGSTAWKVTTRNVLESTESTAIFDAVIVCNGHFTVPKYPDNLIGKDVFRGRLEHSHTYRGPGAYAGRSVLIIGAGPSAMDIGWAIRNTASKLCISTHGVYAGSMANAFGVAAIRPDVATLTETGPKFTDGSEEDFDTILYCTGYLYSFPFLDTSCGIRVHNNHVQPLFKHCVNIERPTMFLIGLTSIDLPATVMDTQVRFVVALLQKKCQLPDRAGMERVRTADVQRCRDLGYVERNSHRISDYVQEYVHELEELYGAETRMRPVLFKIFRHFLDRTDTAWATFRQEKVTIVNDETFTTEYLPRNVESNSGL